MLPINILKFYLSLSFKFLLRESNYWYIFDTYSLNYWFSKTYPPFKFLLFSYFVSVNWTFFFLF